MGVGRYKRLKREKGTLLIIPKVSVSIPSPKENDYVRGYIVRYFVQKANDLDSVIYEVSKNRYSDIQTSDLYSNISLDWRITGDPIDVRKSNSESIRIASKKIPKIALYLPNLLQFHKK
jgi:hypothetical protein